MSFDEARGLSVSIRVAQPSNDRGNWERGYDNWLFSVSFPRRFGRMLVYMLFLVYLNQSIQRTLLVSNQKPFKLLSH